MDKNKRKGNLVKKLLNVFYQAERNGVSRDDIQNIFINSFEGNLQKGALRAKQRSENEHDKCSQEIKEKRRRAERIKSLIKQKYMYVVMFFLGVFSTIAFYGIQDIVTETLAERCLIMNNEYSSEMARPIAECSICRDLDSIPVEHGISVEDFRRKYAYSSVPVLIKDATSTWSAMSHFSFDFFKNLYTDTKGAMEHVDAECQFIPYKTEFVKLSEVFRMSDERAKFKDGEDPWYIGWSNCISEVRSKLRQYYQRPYFLPNNSESSTIDWIFMGGSGPGAHIHVDFVFRPSWQAQISGLKTWTLIPPPECETECKAFNVTMHKGDILVVDTNVWYHSTFIHPGEISITIGSEFD